MTSKATAKPAADASARLGGMDMLRFIFCVGVLFAHFWFLGPLEFGEGTWPALHHPNLALIEYLVHAFFMISGFAVMYTIKGRTALAFAVARFARMWPALAACSIITWISVRHAFEFSPGFQQVLNSWLLVPLAFDRGAGADWSYWSMTFEIRFYFLVFVAMVLTDVHKYRLPLIALWLGVTAFDAFAPGNPVAHFIALDYYAGCFIIGALTYVIWEQRGLQRNIAVGLLLAAFAVTSRQLVHEDNAFNESWRTVPAIHITSWIVPVVCWGLLVGSLMITKPFEKRPWLAKLAVTLGALTYPLYLVHQLVGYRIINDLVNTLPANLDWIAPWVASIVVIAVSIPIALWWEPTARPWVQKVLKVFAERLQYTKPQPKPAKAVEAQPIQPGPAAHA